MVNCGCLISELDYLGLKCNIRTISVLIIAFIFTNYSANLHSEDSGIALPCQKISRISHENLEIYLRNTNSSISNAVSCVKTYVDRKPEIKNITFHFSKGIYRITKPIILNEDWVEGRNITFSGDENGVVVTGAKLINDSIKLLGIHDELHKYSVLVPKDILEDIEKPWLIGYGQENYAAPPELMVKGRIAHIARWPDSGFIRATADSSSITIDNNLPLPQVISNRVKAHGYWRYDWADSRLELEKSKSANNVFQLRSSEPKYGFGDNARLYLYGDIAFLSLDGEYALSAELPEIIYLSRETVNSFEVTMLDSLLTIKHAQSISILNIKFTGVRGTAINIEGDNVLLQDSIVTDVGGMGVSLKGNNNWIIRSKIRNTGYGGVKIIGGNRYKLEKANSGIRNSLVESYGRWLAGSESAIRVEGVGINIENNTIRYGPSAGIVYRGNNHIISTNEIYEVARVTGDVGAIYTGRDWSGRGNVVVNNFVHDVIGVGRHGATAYYLDDQASGIILRNNIAWRVNRGILLGGGRDNIIEQNIVVSDNISLAYDARGLTWQAKAVAKDGLFWKKLKDVPYSGIKYRENYPNLYKNVDLHPGRPIGNKIENNILYGRLVVEPLSDKYNPVGENYININPGICTNALNLEGDLPDRKCFNQIWNN